MRKQFWLYVISALIFSLLFGEVLGPMIAKHPLPLLQFPIQFIVYYFVLATIFGWLFKKMGSWTLIIIFAYGVLAEWLLFTNIKGLTDIPGILFFGLFYLFLFGVPYWISKKLAR
jgi:hypothetical protein